MKYARKTLRRFSAILAVLVIAAAVAGAIGIDAQAAAKKPTKISLKSTSATVDIKGKVTVSVKSVKPAGASTSVSYKSSNSKVAKVSSKGIVTGVKAGKAKITATSKVNKNVSAAITITVKNLKASSVTVTPAEASVEAGKTVALKATVKGPKGYYNPGVNWSTSDKTTATVSANGTVTGVKAGTATITATEKGGKVSASCTVTVTEPVEAVEKTKVYVSPRWIKSVIDGEQPESADYVILETSITADPYNAGHIPGSYFCSVRKIERSCAAAYANNTIDYTDAELGNLLAPEALAKVLESYGITKDTTVILYGSHPQTERVAFCFLYCGVENVKVLNGTLTNWKKAGYEVETTVNEPKTKENYSFGCTIPAHPEYVLSKEEVKDNLANNANFKLVSIRSLDEFQGLSDGLYGYMQTKGEIAGAVFGRAGSDANSMQEYLNDDGTLISYETFKEYMADSYVYPTNEACFFCGTGWRATMPLLLAYEAGWKVSLYDGGWWQWTRDLENNEVQMLTPEQARTCSRFNYAAAAKEVTLKVGDTFNNDANIEIFPASGTLPIHRYKSDNDNVVTVDASGNVTAVSPGTATIKMVATDFSGRNDYYTVTVTE